MTWLQLRVHVCVRARVFVRARIMRRTLFRSTCFGHFVVPGQSATRVNEMANEYLFSVFFKAKKIKMRDCSFHWRTRTQRTFDDDDDDGATVCVELSDKTNGMNGARKREIKRQTFTIRFDRLGSWREFVECSGRDTIPRSIRKSSRERKHIQTKKIEQFHMF